MGRGWCLAIEKSGLIILSQWVRSWSLVSRRIAWLAWIVATLELVSAKRSAATWKGKFGMLNEATALDAASALCLHADRQRRGASEFRHSAVTPV